MKFSGILMLVIGLGIGLAAGRYFTPEIWHRETVTKLVAVKSPPLVQVTSPQPMTTDLALISKEENSHLQFNEVMAYVNSLKPEEIPNVVHQLEARSILIDQKVLTALLGRWAEIDPQAALAEVRKDGDPTTANTLTAAAYGAMATRDRDDALKQIQQLPEGDQRNLAMAAIVNRVAETDPAKAFEIAQGMKGGPVDYESLFTQWAKKDIAQATQAVLHLPDSLRRAGFIYTANTLTEKDPKAAMAWVNQLPKSPERDEAWGTVIRQWTLMDPQGVLAWVQNVPDVQEKNAAWGTAVSKWGESDPQAALDYVRTLPEGDLKNAMLKRTIGQLAETDTESALTAALNLPPSVANSTSGAVMDGPRSSFQQGIVSRWIQNEPQAVLDYVKNSVSDDRQKAGLLQAIIPQLTETDRKATAELLANLPASPEKDRAMTSIVYIWAQTNLKAAMAYVDSWPEGTAKKQSMLSLIPQLAGTGDVDSALGMISKLDSEAAKSAHVAIAAAWGKKDLSAATTYGVALPVGDARNTFLQNVAGELFKTDPAAGAQWLSTLPTLGDRNQIIPSVASSWAEKDAASATAYAATLLPGPGQDSLYSAAANQMSSTDPAKALDVANEITNDKGKNETVTAIVTQWISNNPEAASAYIQSMPEGSAKQKAVPAMADSLAKDDPAAAAQWLAPFPDSPQKGTAAANIIRNWDKDDPVKAEAWLSQLPTGFSKDAATKTFSNDTFDADPARAVQLATSISDPKVQQAQVSNLLKKWMGTDSASATVAVQKSALPDDVKNQLLQPKH